MVLRIQFEKIINDTVTKLQGHKTFLLTSLREKIQEYPDNLLVSFTSDMMH